MICSPLHSRHSWKRSQLNAEVQQEEVSHTDEPSGHGLHKQRMMR